MWYLLLAGLIALLALIAACAPPAYHMGDPLTAKTQVSRTSQPAQPPTGSAREGTRVEYRDPNAQRMADAWELKWQQVQNPPDAVTWTDHFAVCGLKYRFRNYDQLFRCLDLFDAKVAAGGAGVPEVELVRRGAPVMSGWLRASAYAELGEPETSLKWTESAWAALPAAFRTADSRVVKHGWLIPTTQEDLKPIEYVAAELGSAGTGAEAPDVAQMYHEGRNNPAALDLRPWMLAMSLDVQRALLYQRLGKTPQAQAALADLERWKDVRMQSGMRPFRGRAQLLSIGPLYAQGEYDRVILYYEALARKVGSTRQHESTMQTVDWTLLLPVTAMSHAVMRAGTPRDTRLFAIAVEDVSNALLYAQALEHVGRIDDARAMLDTLLAMPEIRAMGNLYWVTLYERGRIALQQGQREAGVRLLSQSVDAIESVRSTISFEAAKIGFAGDKQSVYAALIGALAQAGDWQPAFVYAERAKARALVDLLAQRRDLGPPPAADDKVRELFAQAVTVDSGLGIPNNDQSARGIKLVADARESLVHTAPEAASLISVPSVDVAAITARLGPDESLIDYYVQEAALYAFVLHGAGVTGVTLSAKGLDEEVRAFRAAIEQRAANTGDLGRSLHDRLIRPLLPALQGTRAITIAPHGVLHYLPFAALPDGQGYLIDRFSLRLIPSASALVYLRTGQPKKPGMLLALGNPDLGDRRYDLPNAQLEAQRVAAMFPDSRALVRGEASKSAVMELGNGFSILHFATHGHFDANTPLSSGLYLAKGREPDGVLAVSDLYSIRWDVDLVTLSACETALGKVANGDDVIGLTRGFLYAGARSIVASLWEVDDAATEKLMVSFYGKLDGHNKREALRLAQIEIRKSYPQPAFWAAFQVVGDAP